MVEYYDRNESNGGGSFMIGLITGAVLGAGLGLLFAPRSGTALRSQLSKSAGDWADAASQGYRRAADAASDLADRGREVYDRARDVVSRTADEAERFARDATDNV